MSSLAIWYVVMGLGLVGMIWCAKSQNKVANAKLYAMGCLGVVVLSAIMVLVNFFTDPEQELAMDNSNRFELAKVSKIADFVNSNFAGKKVVILIRQDMLPVPDSEFVRVDQVKEMKARLKGVEVLDTVIIAPPPAKDGEPPAFELSLHAPSFDAKFKECKKLGADVIIDLAGLPMGEVSKNLVIWGWRGKNDPKIVLPEVNDIGYSFEAADLKGVIAGVIVIRNDRKFNFMEDKAPKDLNEAFDKLYVFVTKDNVMQLVKDKTISIASPAR